MRTHDFKPIETTASVTPEGGSARRPRPSWVSLARARRTAPVHLSWVGLVPPSMGR